MIIDTVEGFKTIAGRTDPSAGKIIAVRSAEQSVERMAPLDSLSAEWLAVNHQLHLKARLDAHARDRKGESFFPMRHS